MKPRITINTTAQGELEIWLNAPGRDLLVKELQGLSEKSDHFHLGVPPSGEVALCSTAYRSDDKILECGKVLFRTDEWDRKYFPHVLDDEPKTSD